MYNTGKPWINKKLRERRPSMAGLERRSNREGGFKTAIGQRKVII